MIRLTHAMLDGILDDIASVDRIDPRDVVALITEVRALRLLEAETRRYVAGQVTTLHILDVLRMTPETSDLLPGVDD